MLKNIDKKVDLHDLLEELKENEQNVLNVERLKRFNHDKREMHDTPAIKITFRLARLPNLVKA